MQTQPTQTTVPDKDQTITVVEVMHAAEEGTNPNLTSTADITVTLTDCPGHQRTQVPIADFQERIINEMPLSQTGWVDRMTDVN